MMNIIYKDDPDQKKSMICCEISYSVFWGECMINIADFLSKI